MGRSRSLLERVLGVDVDDDAARALARVQDSQVILAPARSAGPSNGVAVASLVLGILGVVLALVPVVLFFISVPISVAALVTGVKGSNRSVEGAPYRELASAGLILGGIGCALPVLWLLILT